MKRKDTIFFPAYCFQISKLTCKLTGWYGKRGCILAAADAIVTKNQTKMYTGRRREFCRRITKPLNVANRYVLPPNHETFSCY